MHESKCPKMIATHPINEEMATKTQRVCKGHAQKTSNSLHLCKPLEHIVSEVGQSFRERMFAVEGKAGCDLSGHR